MLHLTVWNRYITVFIVFGVPAILMATDFCQSGSSAHTAHASADHNNDNPDITYGTCDVWCEFVLAFRSLATVAVFFSSRARRAELANPRNVGMLLLRRVTGCCTSSRPTSEDSPILPDAIPLVPLRGKGGGGGHKGGHPEWHIVEAEIELKSKLAEGSFGIVWSARWRNKVSVLLY